MPKAVWEVERWLKWGTDSYTRSLHPELRTRGGWQQGVWQLTLGKQVKTTPTVPDPSLAW